MKLSKIEIVNYRSISNVTITPTPTCQGFVGVNESGKSNILSAIALLSSDIKLNADDVRLEGKDEERNQDSYVEYSFALSDSEIGQLIDDLVASIYHEASLPKLDIHGKKVSLKTLFSSKNTGLYCCDIGSETKIGKYYLLSDDERIPLPWLKKVVKVSSSSITTKSGKSLSLSKHRFVETACIPDSHMSYFEDCTTEDINEAFGSLQIDFVEKNLPKVVYWKYDSKHLLPSSIDLDSFRNDPTICIPLKSMFQLAGYHNVTNTLRDIENERPQRLASLLKKVSEKSTEYLQKVWKDYKSISFELRANGSNIDIHIQDAQNFYDCEQRSDGFKRFLTFLLVLSAPVNNGEITDSIIVIDEPDTGIHILGQKCLVQELIRISKNNLVFFSTHSIFMIDRKEPSRHFIVSKKNEITTIAQASSSTYTDDEVLFNALGYSIFETLQPRNIIFEGWADKHVFEIALASKKGKTIKGLGDFGFVHATGVKTIIGIAKDMELANRQYCVISDSDGPAIDKRKEYHQKELCQGCWHTYEDFFAGVFTLEDFVKHTAFKKPIEQVRKDYSELGVFDFVSFSSLMFKRENFIKNWVKSYISNKDLAKSIVTDIKNAIYSNITSSQIEDSYYVFWESLSNKLTV